MQCVIDISKNSQKMQWSMRIGTFLETGRLALKCWRNMLFAGCNLPGIPLNNTSVARKLFKICGNMQYIISFDEDEP